MCNNDILMILKFKDSEKSSNLNLYNLNGYFADEKGVEIDNVVFQSKVRFYLKEGRKRLTFNPDMSISITPKIDNCVEVVKPKVIKEGKLQSILNTDSKKLRYIDIEIDKKSSYEELNGEKKFELIIGVKGNTCVSENDTVAKVRLSQKVVIVIDPGHGVNGGNVGAQARLYTHFVQDGATGKVLMEGTNKKKEKDKKPEYLPDYVINSPSQWIDSFTLDNETADGVFCRTEHNYVLEISKNLKRQIEKERPFYHIVLTRENYLSTLHTRIEAIRFRNDIANKEKADYFISLHLDGGENLNSTGSVALYNKEDATGNNFADAIMRYYTVIKPNPACPRTDIGVLGSSNMAKYKVLIELGYMATSPKDIKVLLQSDSKESIANQLTKGLFEHIDNNF